MNTSAILKILFNLLGTFAVGYGTAIASGQPTKTAVVAGIVTAATGQVGLHQTAPSQSQS